MSRRYGIGVVVVCVLVLLGCGEETKVGSNNLLNFTPAPVSPSPSPSAASQPTTVVTTRPGATPSARPTTSQAVVHVYALQMTPSGFNPSVLHVPTGGRVRFFNNDSAAHTWTSDGGYWDSGQVAAGRTWDYVANTAGDFFYHDANHASFIGELQVG